MSTSEPGLSARLLDLEKTLERILDILSEPVRPDPLWKVEDVATRLGVSKRTVETLISTGEIKPIRIKGQRRFDGGAIEAYIRRCAEKRGRRRVIKS